MCKKISITLLVSFFFVVVSTASAQTTTIPVFYDQSGNIVNGFNNDTDSLIPGWYYSEEGNPLYYYENGVYYDPSTQSYGGSVIYPNADGPQSTTLFTPGAPETGVGRTALYAWLGLLLSGAIAVYGAHYLSKSF